MTIRRVVLSLLLAGLPVTLASAPVAHATSTSAWWSLNATAAPTFMPHTGEAQIILTATNLGDKEVIATEQAPVILTDQLPPGVKPLTARVEQRGVEQTRTSCAIDQRTVTCTGSGPLPPDTELATIDITVEMQEPGTGPLENVVSIEGAGIASPPRLEKPLQLRNSENEQTPFGVETYKLTPESEDGSLDTQAGSHPFQLTTTLDFNQTLIPAPRTSEGFQPAVAALPRDLRLKLPPGLLGDPGAVPSCSRSAFSAFTNGGNLCPEDTTIGVAHALVYETNPARLLSKSIPVFNLEPAAGEPASFGFIIENVPIVIGTAVPSGGDYAVEARLTNISQAVSVLSSQVTLWGVPADPRHDASRGYGCLAPRDEHFPCEPSTETPTAFLTLPTSCETTPATTVTGDSWAAGPSFPEQSINEQQSSTPFPTLTGCGGLEFNPSIAVEPESHSASITTGLNVGVEMPQPGLTAPGPEDRAEAALKQTTVKLPPGLELNPAAANALEDCKASEFDFLDAFEHPFGEDGVAEEQQTTNETFPSPFTPEPPDCPDAAKVGTVNITTPLLPHELTGSVYLAAQNVNPFKSPLAIYLLAEDPEEGIRVKLAGSVQVEPDGQVISTFANTPQLSLITSLRLHLFGGERASFSTPPQCGPARTTSEFVPWSEPEGTPAKPEASFQIASGAGGGPCPPSPLAFSPSFKAGPASPQAGTVSPIFVDIGRPDGDQALNGISVSEPPGFAAILASVTPCPEPPSGQEWVCGEDSHIGEVKEYAGLGTEPVVLTGQAYLTSGYDGAPFGLLVRTLAAAGPFNLGWVNVRSRIDVNPNTAVVTVTSDPGPRGEAIPTILDGVPVQLKALEVAVNRPGFTFGPTNCSPMSFTGTLNGSEGAADPVSSPFTAENCASLAFHPGFEASTGGHGSKQNGTNLNVKVTSQGLGVANIQKVDLQFPKALSSRLTTLQKACTEAAFNTNPSSCDPDSVIGHATVHTPILKSPLTGPAYLVSHGGAAFPDVEFVLQGEGVKIVLDGKTDIKEGITYSKFESAPDAPFTTFETELPSGPDSIFTANVPEKEDFNLCKASLAMPTTIVAQDGAVIEPSTKIVAQGCGEVKSSKVSKLTLAQQLNKALAQCRKRYKHSKSRREHCESEAHARYVKLALAACRKQHKHAKKKRVACESLARRRYGAHTASRAVHGGERR